MHGFETVSGIGQGPGHDDAHGVIEIGDPHLILDGGVFYNSGQLKAVGARTIFIEVRILLCGFFGHRFGK